MTALATERNTRVLAPSEYEDVPLAAATTVFQGGIVCINAAGYGVPGSTSTTLKTVGLAQQTVTNSGSAGDKTVRVYKGVSELGNSSAGDLIAIADKYTDCYIVDDQTVAKTSGGSTRSVAGKVVGVSANGVMVHLRPY